MKNNPINFDTLFNSTKLYTFQEFWKKNRSQNLTSYHHSNHTYETCITLQVFS